MTTINLERSIEGYRRFLQVKRLPSYKIHGHLATFPDEYADRIGIGHATDQKAVAYQPPDWLFDYQRDIAKLAIAKQKFCVFADCGLGKTLILLEFARHCESVLPQNKAVLIVSPLMVIDQTVAEADCFYDGNLALDVVPASDLQSWLDDTGRCRVGITNYDAIREGLTRGRLGAMILDESSMLKSHYGKYGTRCLELAAGLDWKLALTGTPAPNDRIEYANHAVFVDAYSTVNQFLARFFVNRGQTQERWCLRPHALRPFYRALSHWSIFLTNPVTYGWSDNCETIPPIHVHIHDIDLTQAQNDIVGKETGCLFAVNTGGITNRQSLSSLAKGQHKGKQVESNKPEYIRQLVESFGSESTIVWCIYNHEQDRLAELIPNSASITGTTPHDERMRIIDGFKAGAIRTLISKPKILGFGLNLQRCTRQVFSGLQDSYESYYQAVKRSNRIGSLVPLNVHIPITELERPMVENVLRKAARDQHDTEEQEILFKDAANSDWRIK